MHKKGCLTSMKCSRPSRGSFETGEGSMCSQLQGSIAYLNLLCPKLRPGAHMPIGKRRILPFRRSMQLLCRGAPSSFRERLRVEGAWRGIQRTW
jgi:hypothetical protein